MAKRKGAGPVARVVVGVAVAAAVLLLPHLLLPQVGGHPAVARGLQAVAARAGWIAGGVLVVTLVAAFAARLARSGAGGGVPFYARIVARRRSGPEWGYVYVLSNAAMPGMLKVGFTDRHPKVRAKELRTTGVPEPFRVEFAIRSDFARRIEAQAHRLLDEERLRKDREFVRAPLDKAIDVVKRAERQVRGAMGGR